MKRGLFLRGMSTLIILSMSVTLLMAGCSGGTKNAGATTAATTAGNTAGTTTAEAPEKRGSISVSIYNRGDVPANEGTITDNRWTKWINENGPVDVKFVAIPRWESTSKFNTLFAAGDAPDLIFEYDTSYRNQLYAQKLLLPIDELIENHSTVYKEMMRNYPEMKVVGTKSDGKLYEAGRVLSVMPNITFLIRADWMEKLKMKAPQTSEELFQLAKAFAESDPDENGKKDTYGISMSNNSNLKFMFQDVDWVVKDGQLIKGWDMAKASTEYRKRLFDAGLVDKDFLTDSTSQKAVQDWVNGKTGIYNGVYWDFNTFETLKKNNPNAKIIAIALPETEFGRFLPQVSNPVQMTAAVNAKAKDPVSVIKYIDFLSKKETSVVLENGIEGVHWKLGANGIPERDADKRKTEVYTQDFLMLSQRILAGKWYTQQAAYNPNIPVHKEFTDLLNMCDEIYLDTKLPFAQFTHPEHMPELPKDLQLVTSTVKKTIDDLWLKCIVSGTDYTPDQALKDAMASWEKAGGGKLEDWYRNWYAENKDKWFLFKDFLKYRYDGK